MISLSQLEEFYKSEGQEELRLLEGGAHYLEFLTATRYLERYLVPGGRVLDSCAGSGVYAFYLAERGHKVTAGDIVAYNVDIIRQKQSKNPILAEIYLGDAKSLPQFPDSSFGAVLCMGALYHMDDPAHRKQTLLESARLTGDNGLVAVSYMNRYAVILNNCAGKLDNIDEILRFASDGREKIFYASTPSEMEKLMADCSLDKVCHVALDGMSTFLRHTAKLIDDDGLERWREYHLAVCEEQCLLGSSYHNLIIGRKRAG